MWLDKNQPNNLEAPLKYYINGYVQSWKIYNPDYKYILWNHEKVDELFKIERFKKYKIFWDELKLIQKCDFTRYMIMSEHGGIYGDLDFRLTNSLDHVVKDVKDLMLFLEPGEHTRVTTDFIAHRVSNSVLISRPYHPFWEELMENIVETYKPKKSVMKTTGPSKLASFIFKKGYLQSNPEWFGNRCLFMAFHWMWGTTSDCDQYFGKMSCHTKNPDNFKTEKARKKPYNKLIGFTTWREGTGWGLLTLKNQLKNNKKTIKEYEEYWNPIIKKEKSLENPNFNGKVPDNIICQSSGVAMFFSIILLVVVLIISITISVVKANELKKIFLNIK